MPKGVWNNAELCLYEEKSADATLSGCDWDQANYLADRTALPEVAEATVDWVLQGT